MLYNKTDMISERHSHRYEFNNDYLEVTHESAGMKVTGVNPETGLSRNN